MLDSRTLRSTPECGHRAGYDGAKRKRGSSCTWPSTRSGTCWRSRSCAPRRTTAPRVGRLAKAVQEATGERVEAAFVDQGYLGDKPAAAEAQGIALAMVRLPQAKRGFVILRRR